MSPTWGKEVTAADIARIQAEIKGKGKKVSLLGKDYEPLHAGGRPKSTESITVRKQRQVVKTRERRAAKKATTPTISEHSHQAAVIVWWNLWAPTKGLDVRLLFSVPNGSNKSWAAAGKFKAEGLRAGVPDLCLALPHPAFHGLYVEMKSLDGRVKADQAEYHTLLRRQDYCVVVCYGADEAIRAITHYVESGLNRPAKGVQEFKQGTQDAV